MSLDEQLRNLKPDGQLREFFEFVCGLVPQFASVLVGLRPGMDLWVRKAQYDSFKAYVEKLGFFVESDTAFRSIRKDQIADIVGFGSLTTTQSFGIPLQEAMPGDEVHVFLGRSLQIANDLRASGWYPTVINGRPFHKPFVDHLEFGRQLGFPECCVDFFESRSDWNNGNIFESAVSNTRGHFDYHANSFGKNRNFSLNFHMPCSFDCRKTIEFSIKLERYLDSVEPRYMQRCRELLKKPILALSENQVLLFEGTFKSETANQLEYSEFANLAATPPETIEKIADGDSLEVKGRFLLVFGGRKLRHVIECRQEFRGPQVPLLFNWQ